MNVIADSGFIAAFWDEEDPAHSWARKWMGRATLPILTSAANLLEAGFLLANHEIVLRMVKDGDLKAALDFQAEIEALHSLVEKYSPRMDLADAAIVRLSELHPRHTVLTVDKTDFTIYRRFAREKIPCDFGPH